MSYRSIYKKSRTRTGSRAKGAGVGGRMSVGVRRTPRTQAKAKKNTFTQWKKYMDSRAKMYNKY